MIERRKPALIAWALCGALDIIYAMTSSVMQGGTATNLLRAVASGPFGDGARDWGTAGALAGLAVHFAIMAVIVAVFVATRRRWPKSWPWWVVGTIYGLAVYLVMNAVVVQLRFGIPFPPADLGKAAVTLFPHIFFVGWPLAWLTLDKEAR